MEMYKCDRCGTLCSDAGCCVGEGNGGRPAFQCMSCKECTTMTTVDIADLAEPGPLRCPKCRSTKITTEYCYNISVYTKALVKKGLQAPGRPEAWEGECLHRVCECGYGWYTNCLDKEKEDGPIS